MPARPRPRCSYPGCGGKAVHDGLCAEHRRKPWANPSAHTRLRSQNQAEWRWLRAFVLDRDRRTCRRCGRTHCHIVDHIIPVGADGAFLDPNNCQTLCEACNEWKDSDDRRRYPLIFH